MIIVSEFVDGTVEIYNETESIYVDKKDIRELIDQLEIFEER